MRKSFVALSLAVALAPVAGFADKAAKSHKAAPAATEPAPAPVPELRFEPALAKLDKKVAGLFGAEVQKQLRLVAEAAVLTDYCAAVNLNQQKFRETFEAVAAEGAAGRKPADQRNYENKLSMYYGVYVGLLVAEGTEQRAELCGFAESALKEGRPIARYWLPAAITPPAAAGGAGAAAVPAVRAPAMPDAPALPKP
jgi:hypothetical protein